MKWKNNQENLNNLIHTGNEICSIDINEKKMNVKLKK